MEKLYICLGRIDCTLDCERATGINHNFPHEFYDCNDKGNIHNCPSCIEYKPEPTGQLYILPPIAELLADTGDPIEFTRPYDNGIEAVYASAKPVDKIKISIAISEAVLNRTDKNYPMYLTVKQAIDDYIKESNNDSK